MVKSTKEEIIETAFELFSESLYGNVSIKEITDEANVSKGAIFHYFDSKFELANKSLINEVEKVFENYYSEINQLKDPKKKLKLLIDFSIDLYKEKPKLMRFFMQIYELYMEKDQEQVLERWMNMYFEYTKVITDLYKECGATDPSSKAHLLMSNLDGLRIYFLVMNDFKNFPSSEKLKEQLYKIHVENILKFED